MFDDVCIVLRDIICDAIKDDVTSEDGALMDAAEIEGISLQYTDGGLALQIEDRLYGIRIERV